MNHPRLGAIGVVIHDSKVLLVKRGKAPNAGLWSFPGGRVEFGETGLVAAAREVLEETGVSVTPVRYLTNVDVILRQDDRVTDHYLLAAVVCEFVSGEVIAGDDAADARWVKLDRVDRLERTERVDHVLRLASLSFGS